MIVIIIIKITIIIIIITIIIITIIIIMSGLSQLGQPGVSESNVLLLRLMGGGPFMIKSHKKKKE